MTAIGRAAAALVVLGAVVLIFIATLRPDLMHVGPVHMVDWAGMMIYVGAPVAWISAILHWAQRFPREGPRVRWGLVVVLGFVPGAIVYWLWGARRAAGRPALSGPAQPAD